MKIKANAAIMRYYKFTIDVDDDATDAEIRAIAKEHVFEHPEIIGEPVLGIDRADIEEIYMVEKCEGRNER